MAQKCYGIDVIKAYGSTIMRHGVAYAANIVKYTKKSRIISDLYLLKRFEPSHELRLGDLGRPAADTLRIFYRRRANLLNSPMHHPEKGDRRMFLGQCDWANIKDYFRFICEGVERFRLESKADALNDTYLAEDPDIWPGFLYKHEGIIPFRKSDDQEQLELQFQVARDLIPKMRAAIEARELTLEFLAGWGRLNYAVGHVMCAWFARDYDDLVAERSARKSADKRNKDRHRILVASHLLPLIDKGMGRKEAERTFAARVQAAIAAGEPMPPLNAAELPDLLEDGHLKTTYGETKLTKTKMEAVLADAGSLCLHLNP